MADNITARSLMRPAFLRMGAGHTVREALGVLLDPQARREDPRVVIVLNGDGTFAGLISPKDILKALLSEWANGKKPETKDLSVEQQILLALQGKMDVKITQAMNRDVPVLAPEDRLPRLVEIMQTKRLECLPVVEQGRVLGLVLLTDVFNAAANLALGAQGE